MKPATAERLGLIARKAWTVAGTTFALIFLAWILPFWALGFLGQSAWMGLQAGSKDAQNLDRKMGK